MWKKLLLAGLALGILSICATPAAAVILYLKDQPQPIRGYLVRENDQVVVLRELQPDGSTTERSIPRGQIEDLIRSVSDTAFGRTGPRQAGRLSRVRGRTGREAKRPRRAGDQHSTLPDCGRAGTGTPGTQLPAGHGPARPQHGGTTAIPRHGLLLDPAHDPALLQTSRNRRVARSSDLGRQAGRISAQGTASVAARQTEGSSAAGPPLQAQGAFATADQSHHLRRVRQGLQSDLSPLHSRTAELHDLRRQPFGRRAATGSRVPCAACGASGEISCTVCRGNFKANPLSPSLLKRILALELEWLPTDAEKTAVTVSA